MNLPDDNGIALEDIGMRDLGKYLYNCVCSVFIFTCVLIDLFEDGQLEQLELLASDSISIRSYEVRCTTVNVEY